MSELSPDDKYVAELEQAIEHIWEIVRRFNLDPFPVHFELVPATIMYEFGSYGLPGRFSHWSRGKSYYRMKTEYDYGLSKIYELVVNTNPSYAFLMEQNSLLQNKLVVAHVLGHTDFFKNNTYFKHTPPNMIDKVSVNADRIRKYEYDHGRAEVERFLDAVLAIEEHIDTNFQIKRESSEERAARLHGQRDGSAPAPYDDLWDLEGRKTGEQQASAAPARRFPTEPEKDILLFLAEHAPHLEDWQRDVLLIVREEMQYFVPQMQTKVLNEGWACLVGGSLVLTNRGLLRYDALHTLLVGDESLSVASGHHRLDRVTDRHVRRNAPTVRLRTRRGLVIEGAEQHRLQTGRDQWIALGDVAIGQRVPLVVGSNIWPRAQVPLAAAAGAQSTDLVAAGALPVCVELEAAASSTHARPANQVAPTHVHEAFAELLGYLVAGGALRAAPYTIVYVTADHERADRYTALVTEMFGIRPHQAWGNALPNGKAGLGHVEFASADVLRLLDALDINLPALRIPDAILRSPKPVVSAFLRAYCESEGSASARDGVTLAIRDDDMGQTLQVLLLNYGILSQRHAESLSISGNSAKVFETEIGFGSANRRELLHAYLERHRWFQPEDLSDEVVSIERSVADVYDITVETSHRYVAGGMLHHNSFWHARILREMDLTDSEYTEFAQLHSSVLSPNRMRINPYHLGYKILEDIERRWDHPSEEDQARRGMQPGQGRAKIFEVREVENDVSLLRNYLTKELVEDLDLYVYKKVDDEWVIVEKNWERVRDSIVASMTNFGYPYLAVVDGDFAHNSELLVRHQFEGQEMDLPYAEKTLEYVHLIWGRPVHLETVYEGKRIRLSYNGEKHVRTLLDRSERGEKSERGERG